jgi:hypothetical protein
MKLTPERQRDDGHALGGSRTRRMLSKATVWFRNVVDLALRVVSSTIALMR